MSRWPRDSHRTAAYVTSAGADWLASASPFPRSVRALWAQCPTARVTLPCGTAFDVISMPALFGRKVVGRLWSDGPGTGPVAAQRGRIMVFAAVGAAQRLPALLSWREWGGATPPLLFHGAGDTVAIPPPEPTAGEQYAGEQHTVEQYTVEQYGDEQYGDELCAPYLPAPPPPPPRQSLAAFTSRWLVAPDVRSPWLPGAEALLWACVRTARAGSPGTGRTAMTSASAVSPG